MTLRRHQKAVLGLVAAFVATIVAGGCESSEESFRPPPPIPSKAVLEQQLADVKSNPKIAPMGKAMAEAEINRELQTAK